MARFQIPQIYMPGFEAISKLNKTQTSELESILKETKIGIGLDEFLTFISKNSNIESVREIGTSLYSVGSAFSSDGNYGLVATELAESFFMTNENASRSEISRLSSNLLTLLSASENLTVTFKAQQLLLENGNLFKDVRVLSDIRLVFNNDLNEHDRKGVIVHRLKIEHYIDGEVREMYFSMDNGDLKKLKKVVDRAIEKEKIIKADYKNNIHFIEMEE